MIKARTAYREFQFLRPANTSRGNYLKKSVHFIILYYTDDPSIAGIGECSLFPGLSFDDKKGFEIRLNQTIERINQGDFGADPTLSDWPSINFALETAWKDIRVNGSKVLYPSRFTEGKDSIGINGLIWMGSREDILKQIRHKLEDGFSCLKLKVGALNFDDELELLEILRREYPADELEIRVDANGAFKPRQAQEMIKRLSEFDIHSIEQPIPKGHVETMASLCASSPIPIALDEELIGKHTLHDRRVVMDFIKPQYIVLKPGLLGGLSSCAEWIRLAAESKTGWWITSSLETNIGLNAIAQWTYTLKNAMAQGLSTGSLYAGNFHSPLYLYGERLYHDPEIKWDLSVFDEASGE
jgi:L-alanine-DL-glutamate epimerase-like enolase superfamily enzyme